MTMRLDLRATMQTTLGSYSVTPSEPGGVTEPVVLRISTGACDVQDYLTVEQAERLADHLYRAAAATHRLAAPTRKAAA